jgi:predicted transcriptional regulator
MATKTTIQVSQKLKEELDKYQLHDFETYEDIIWDFIDDRKMLNEETLKEIEQARKDYREGKYITHEQLKKKLGL